MTGAISGAAGGENGIPERWLRRVLEQEYTPGKVRQLALALFEEGQKRNFKTT